MKDKAAQRLLLPDTETSIIGGSQGKHLRILCEGGQARRENSPSVKHEQEALAAAGLRGFKGPLLGALCQCIISLACWPVPAHLLFQAHVPELLHQHLLNAEIHWICKFDQAEYLKRASLLVESRYEVKKQF